VSQQTTNRSFDELARALASGSISRGKALRLMGAALLGGTLGSLGGVAAADDECKPLNKKCRKDHQCCSRNCEGGQCAAAGCPAGTVRLSNGTCAKPCSGAPVCRPSCVGCAFDITPGAAYCSSGLGQPCTSPTDCVSGVCSTFGTCECTSDSQCPSGWFCEQSGTCVVACTPA
jgi:hypothetical protein